MKLFTTEEIHKWRDLFVSKAPKVLEMSGKITPVCFFLLASGKTHVVALQSAGGDFPTLQEKEGFASFIRKYGKENDVVAILFASEGWMKKLNKDEANKYKGVSVKDIEGSQECVYYCFETKLTSELMSQAIEVDSLGRKVLSDKMERGMAEKGMFCNILGVPVSKN
jgi:hypothetical protein